MYKFTNLPLLKHILSLTQTIFNNSKILNSIDQTIKPSEYLLTAKPWIYIALGFGVFLPLLTIASLIYTLYNQTTKIPNSRCIVLSPDSRLLPSKQIQLLSCSLILSLFNHSASFSLTKESKNLLIVILIAKGLRDIFVENGE